MVARYEGRSGPVALAIGDAREGEIGSGKRGRNVEFEIRIRGSVSRGEKHGGLCANGVARLVGAQNKIIGGSWYGVRLVARKDFDSVHEGVPHYAREIEVDHAGWIGVYGKLPHGGDPDAPGRAHDIEVG